MSRRIYPRDVHAVARALSLQMWRMNLLKSDETLAVQEGSKLNGNSWGLLIRDANGWLRASKIVDMNGKYTAREAWEAIHTAMDVLFYVEDVKGI